MRPAALRPTDEQSPPRLFRAQWQDIILAAAGQAASADRVVHMILADITAFLHRRGLEYFSGFRRMSLPPTTMSEGRFYRASRGFTGFVRVPAPLPDARSGRYFNCAGFFGGFTRLGILSFSVKQGGWLHG